MAKLSLRRRKHPGLLLLPQRSSIKLKRSLRRIRSPPLFSRGNTTFEVGAEVPSLAGTVMDACRRSHTEIIKILWRSSLDMVRILTWHFIFERAMICYDNGYRHRVGFCRDPSARAYIRCTWYNFHHLLRLFLSEIWSDSESFARITATSPQPKAF